MLPLPARAQTPYGTGQTGEGGGGDQQGRLIGWFRDGRCDATHNLSKVRTHQRLPHPLSAAVSLAVPRPPKDVDGDPRSRPTQTKEEGGGHVDLVFFDQPTLATTRCNHRTAHPPPSFRSPAAVYLGSVDFLDQGSDISFQSLDPALGTVEFGGHRRCGMEKERTSH